MPQALQGTGFAGVCFEVAKEPTTGHTDRLQLLNRKINSMFLPVLKYRCLY